MDAELETLLKKIPHLCKGGRLFPGIAPRISTGYKLLDAVLPGAGWPVGAVTEILLESMGIGELRLLLPAIRQVTRQGQRVVMINTPYRPYAPALVQSDIDLNGLFLISPANREDALWAAEKALHGGVCKLLLLWPDGFGYRPVDNKVVRRLQVAAQTTGSVAVLYRESASSKTTTVNQSHWAVLRLRLSIEKKEFKVDVLKMIGTAARPSIRLNL